MRRWRIVGSGLIAWASVASIVFAQEGRVTARSQAPFAKVAEALEQAISDQKMALVCHANAQKGAAATLAEIREWSRQALGVDRVPAVWRALAHQPRLLDATWRKDRLVLSAGALDELVKGCAALAVAQFRQSAYWIAYLTQFLRTRCGLADRGVVELAGAVMHYVSFNTISHGMRLDSPMADLQAVDVAPGGRFEQFLPGGRPRPAP